MLRVCHEKKCVYWNISVAFKCVWTLSILFNAKRSSLKTSVLKKTGRSDNISHVNLVAMECVGKTTTLLRRCGCNIVILLTAHNSLFVFEGKRSGALGWKALSSEGHDCLSKKWLKENACGRWKLEHASFLRFGRDLSSDKKVWEICPSCKQQWGHLERFVEGCLRHLPYVLCQTPPTVLIRLQADLGYKPRPQTSHAKNWLDQHEL